ncbi:OBAP family protein [Luteimonas deserti]|uniref:OBAP family protein n=1 Tax=Luteimonas deserti TaxID=2752306 RepID=A0A7Z0QPS7_9GAMM|nr:OBAP family protein [Luteimonas deserti]NYZ62592.1 OBAP family protein [Luteimonas deserti]
MPIRLPRLSARCPIWPCLALLALGACTREAAPPVEPPGAPRETSTRLLEAGARVLQDRAPLRGFDMHIVGFHPMKDDPTMQMEAHHYCHQVNEDFAQCALFDGDGMGANLTGVEYIISARLFADLPADERALWHPHNGEILSGQLIAPGIPEPAERALMRQKINSYGKTWHTWHSRHGTRPGDSMPTGPALLAWSFNRDGEVDPALLAERDARLGVDSTQRRLARDELRSLARPQSGVDALRTAFPDAVPIPGVVEAEADPSTR